MLRKKIIKKGYYNTNTLEIANYAGVSTGIIYQYFTDKKDIFIEGVKNYSNNIMYPMLDVLENETIDINRLDKIIERLINKFIKNHTISKKAHEELMAMSHLESEIAEIFTKNELAMTKKIDTILKRNNIYTNNSIEKIHIVIGIVDNLCHEIVYHHHDEINYGVMKNEVIKLILYILK